MTALDLLNFSQMILIFVFLSMASLKPYDLAPVVINVTNLLS